MVPQAHKKASTKERTKERKREILNNIQLEEEGFCNKLSVMYMLKCLEEP